MSIFGHLDGCTTKSKDMIGSDETYWESMSGLKQTLQMSRPTLSELNLYELNWSRPDTVGHAVVNLVPSCNLGFTFLSVLRPIIWSVSTGFLSVSMRICGVFQSSTVYLRAGGCRGQCLGGWPDVELPGREHQCGHVGHLPDKIRCPRRPPVDPPAWWWGMGSCQSHAGGLGCDVVFLAISCRDIFPWSNASELFRGVDVPSNVEWHHHSNGSISWVTLQGLISRIWSVSWKSERWI